MGSIFSRQAWKNIVVGTLVATAAGVNGCSTTSLTNAGKIFLDTCQQFEIREIAKNKSIFAMQHHLVEVDGTGHVTNLTKCDVQCVPREAKHSRRVPVYCFKGDFYFKWEDIASKTPVTPGALISKCKIPKRKPLLKKKVVQHKYSPRPKTKDLVQTGSGDAKLKVSTEKYHSFLEKFDGRPLPRIDEGHVLDDDHLDDTLSPVSNNRNQDATAPGISWVQITFIAVLFTGLGLAVYKGKGLL
eukprot:115267_1